MVRGAQLLRGLAQFLLDFAGIRAVTAGLTAESSMSLRRILVCASEDRVASISVRVRDLVVQGAYRRVVIQPTGHKLSTVLFGQTRQCGEVDALLDRSATLGCWEDPVATRRPFRHPGEQ